MITRKIIKKGILYFILTIMGILSAIIASSFLYKDELIQTFITEANKSINTPIEVGKIGFSVLDNFPLVSITFDQVMVRESFKGSNKPLLIAEKIYCAFNPIKALMGEYKVSQVIIEDAQTHLKIDKQGRSNFDIFKNSEDKQNTSISFALNKIKLKNVAFEYSNFQSRQYLNFFANDIKSTLKATGDVFDLTIAGKLVSNSVQIEEKPYFENKSLDINSALQYDQGKGAIYIGKSIVGINASQFEVYGDYIFKSKSEINLYLDGKNTSVQTLVSLLPGDIKQKLDAYQSNGNVYFDMALNGKNHSPSLEVNFGFDNATIYHPETKAKIENASFQGTYRSKSLRNLKTAYLRLENINGSLNQKAFESDFTLKNLEDPRVSFSFDGQVDVPSLLNFYPTKEIKKGSGSIDINMQFEGKTKDLENKSTVQKVNTSGELNMNDVSFALAINKLPFTNLNGSLLFNKNDLAISNVSGKLGSTDFLLNGFFKNIISYLLFDGQPVGIEADLRSNHFNLDELLQSNASEKPQSPSNHSEYSFNIPPNLFLSFNCDIKALSFRRFKPKNIKGDLKVKNQLAIMKRVETDALNGKISFSSILDAQKKDKIEVSTNLKLTGIDIDSIFYVFENFNQDFLQDKNLRGKIFADVDAEMAFNKNLEIDPNSFAASISTSIKEGQLNNFEPMQKLVKFVEEDNLDHLRFSEIKNNIQIKNKTIYLPEMEVKSNISDIKLSGTHTFNQEINYRTVIPLNNKNKVDKDEAFGAIENDIDGGSNLYLKITGTTENYHVAYDTESVKKKIISDIKKETNELKEAFKNKGLKKKKEKELAEDEYFDWDN